MSTTKTTNILRKKLFLEELEQVRSALQDLQPEPVSSDDLKAALEADVRMLIRHGVPIERINETLARYASHITQAFYDTLGRPPRRGKAGASQSKSVSPGESSIDRMAVEGSDLMKAVPPVPTTLDGTPDDVPKISGTPDQTEAGVPHSRRLPSDATALEPDQPIRPMNWTSALRPRQTA